MNVEMAKCELISQQRLQTKEWISDVLSYREGTLVLLSRFYRIYQAQGGTLSQRVFYQVVRETVDSIFSTDQAVKVQKQVDGLVITNVNPDFENKVRSIEAPLHTDSDLSDSKRVPEPVHHSDAIN